MCSRPIVNFKRCKSNVKLCGQKIIEHQLTGLSSQRKRLCAAFSITSIDRLGKVFDNQ